MAHDSIGNWVQKAKSDAPADSGKSGVKVIRREEAKSKGNLIMEIAEKIRPYLMRMFKGVRDEEGQLYQPAHVRGIALNMAQDLLKVHEENSGK